MAPAQEPLDAEDKLPAHPKGKPRGSNATPQDNTGSKGPLVRVCVYNQKNQLAFGLRIDSPVNKTIHFRSSFININ